MQLGKALLLCTLFLARATAAQTRVEFSPFAGAYLPTADLAVVELGCHVNSTYRQQAGLNVGARITVWASSTLALEGTAGYARSTLRITAPPGGYLGASCPSSSADYGTDLIIANMRFLFVPSALAAGRCAEFARGGSTGCAYVSGGLGIVSRSGDVWTNAGGTTSFAGELGFGYRRPIAPSVTLRVDLEDLLYSANIRGPSLPGGVPRFQHDLSATIGLALGPRGAPTAQPTRLVARRE